MNIDQELTKRLLAEEDSASRSAAYNKEIEFYELVASGSTELLEERLKSFGSNQKFGKATIFSATESITPAFWSE